MGRSMYPQAEHQPPTMTVGQLIERLQAHDPALPVVFKSPENGAFGPNHSYTLETAAHVSLDRREEERPGGTYFDDETGEKVTFEPKTHVLHAWAGVVLR